MNRPDFGKLYAEEKELLKKNLDFPSAKDTREKALKAKCSGVLYILKAMLDSVNTAAEKGEFSVTLTLGGIKSTIDVDSAIDTLKNLGYEVMAGSSVDELTAGDGILDGKEFMFRIFWHKE